MNMETKNPWLISLRKKWVLKIVKERSSFDKAFKTYRKKYFRTITLAFLLFCPCIEKACGKWWTEGWSPIQSKKKFYKCLNQLLVTQITKIVTAILRTVFVFTNLRNYITYVNSKTSQKTFWLITKTSGVELLISNVFSAITEHLALITWVVLQFTPDQIHTIMEIKAFSVFVV